jgi:hypothetical protein
VPPNSEGRVASFSTRSTPASLKSWRSISKPTGYGLHLFGLDRSYSTIKKRSATDRSLFRNTCRSRMKCSVFAIRTTIADDIPGYHWKHSVPSLVAYASSSPPRLPGLVRRAYLGEGYCQLRSRRVRRDRDVVLLLQRDGQARSVARLIMLGVLFLAGGWALELTRRKLISNLAGAPA